MKAVLEFSLPEERDEHQDALNGSRYRYQLEDVWTQLFRPRHKHGYGDAEIDRIVDTPDGQKLMEFLEEKYREITRED